MRPEQKEEARALVRAVRGPSLERCEKARRKLRRFFVDLYPTGAPVLVTRGAVTISGTVVGHGEDFDGLHLRGDDFRGHRVTYAELAGLKKRKPKK
jgi:hypothetical protein